MDDAAGCADGVTLGVVHEDGFGVAELTVQFGCIVGVCHHGRLILSTRVFCLFAFFLGGWSICASLVG